MSLNTIYFWVSAGSGFDGTWWGSRGSVDWINLDPFQKWVCGLGLCVAGWCGSFLADIVQVSLIPLTSGSGFVDSADIWFRFR